VTYLMDKIFICLGMDKTEIEASDIRGTLYVGMIYMVGLASAFLVMSIFS